MEYKIPGTNYTIGGKNPCFIIAEAGNNHGGELQKAKELIDIAVRSECDCVKFQKRDTERVLSRALREKPYTGNNSFGPTYGEHRDALELSAGDFKELKAYADSKGILMTASAWDKNSVDVLDGIDVPFYKVASCDLTNWPLLEHTASKGRPLFLSTGMADFDLVKKCVAFIEPLTPHPLVIMHCCSAYPANPKDINLRCIEGYQREFGDRHVVGYSGHEPGLQVSLAAAVLGAKVIERHITYSRVARGTDHAASLEEDGIHRLVRDVHVLEQAMGDGVKRRVPAEDAPFVKLSKSITTECKLAKGTVLEAQHLTTKSPGEGISPMRMQEVIGKKLANDVDADVTLHEKDVEF